MSVERLFATEATQIPEVRVDLKGGGLSNCYKPTIHSVLRTDSQIIYQCRPLHFDRDRETVEVEFKFDGFSRKDVFEGAYQNGDRFIAILRMKAPTCPFAIEINTFRD